MAATLPSSAPEQLHNKPLSLILRRDTPGYIGLLECFSWDEETFLKKQKVQLSDIGYERWRRNAVALGNAPSSPDVIDALTAALDDPSDQVREHARWALSQHR